MPAENVGRRCEPKTTNSHPQGASFAYDGGHAQNRKALADRSTFIVRVRSQASRRDADGAGGLPLVVQAFRSLGLPGSVKQHLVVKERQRGYDEATFVESFVLLNAAGGECLDDFERLRADPGLGQLIGHEVPSPEAARKFLYAFHEEEKIEQA